MKVCKACQKEKPLTAFYLNRRTTEAGDPTYHAQCKACEYEKQKERRAMKTKKKGWGKDSLTPLKQRGAGEAKIKAPPTLTGGSVDLLLHGSWRK